MAPAGGAGQEVETAGFDFGNYLLGLQTSNQVPGEDAKGAVGRLATSKEASIPELLDVREQTAKKDNSPWNLLFPGMAAPAAPALAIPTAKETALPGAASPTGPIAGQATISPVEARLLQRVGLVPDNGNVMPEKTALVAGSHDPKPAASSGVAARALSALDAAESDDVMEVQQQASSLSRTGQTVRVNPHSEPQGAHEPFVGSLAELKQHQAAVESPKVAVEAPAVKENAMHRYAQVQSHTRLAESPTDAYSPSRVKGEEPGAVTSLAEKGDRRHANELSGSESKAAMATGSSTVPVGGAHAPESPVGPGPAAPHSVPHLFTRVESMAQQGGGKMTVSLTPPELGKVEVEVTMRGKRVELRMTSENEAAKSVLQSGLGDLKRSLEGQNLQLSHADVHIARDTAGNSQTPMQSGGGGFFASQQQESRSGSQGWNQPSRVIPPQESRMEPVVARPRAVGNGRVDVRI
jgi:flagellar hook-length control protein FliK